MMKRSLLALAVFGGVANAQPAPAPGTPESAPPVPTPAPEPAPAPQPTPVPERAPLPPQPAAIVEPAPVVDAAVEKAAEPPPAKKLTAGKLGFLSPGLLAQAWFQNERAGDTTQTSQFRLRRAEIAVAGEIMPNKVAFKVMFDAAKVRETTRTTVAGPPDAMGNPTTVTINNPEAKVSVLQDFFITGISQYADVSIGQFKIPVSWEGYNSSGKLMFPERAIVSTTFGDLRDLGVRIEKKLKQVGYSAGVFNGTGLNKFDNNVQKDVALRVEAYPVPGLTIAGVTYDSVGIRQRAGTKDRWEADVRYESGPFLVQAEAIIARDVKADRKDAVPARGMYLLAGYTITNPDLHGELQPVVRIGAYDPDTREDAMAKSDIDAQLHFDVGLNYYLQKHEMKLQAAYQRLQYQDDMKPANNQVIVAAQVMY